MDGCTSNAESGILDGVRCSVAKPLQKPLQLCTQLRFHQSSSNRTLGSGRAIISSKYLPCGHTQSHNQSAFQRRAPEAVSVPILQLCALRRRHANVLLNHATRRTLSNLLIQVWGVQRFALKRSQCIPSHVEHTGKEREATNGSDFLRDSSKT